MLCPVFCVLFLFFVTTPSLSASAGWAATYGGVDSDWAYSVHETNDGGYIMAGATRSFGAGENDIWVLKLRPDGTVEWQKAYGGIENDWAYSIQQTLDGGYIVAGKTWSFGDGASDIWILKLRVDGTVEWQKTYGGVSSDEASSVQQTSDGGYIVAGETKSFGAGDYDSWVLKLRPDGTIEWQKTYGGVSSDGASSVQQTSDGGYIVAGRTKSFGAGDCDIWVLKLRGDGAAEWQKTYGGVEDDGASSIQQTSDGGYIVAGGKGSLDVRKKDLPDILVLKLGPDGAVEWQKTLGKSGWDEASCIQQTVDGGYIVGGWAGEPVWTETTKGLITDAWVSKLRPDGTMEWQKSYWGVSAEYACSIIQTTDGGYVAAGWTCSFGAGRNDVWVLKLNADGSINPSCDLTCNRSLSRKDNSITVKTTTVSPVDSHANLQDSSATIQTTNTSVDLMCH
ncbi:MAG TPA: hypothetical protein VJZ02_06120 [Candidatus Brocadiales bacterium]|nr:hypothetical protein [Candidatus Brocadiales bacterium]